MSRIRLLEQALGRKAARLREQTSREQQIQAMLEAQQLLRSIAANQAADFNALQQAASYPEYHHRRQN